MQCIDYDRRDDQNRATVVFDGYDEAKKVQKRATKKFAVEVSFFAAMSPRAAQEHLLSNDHNKSRLINLLRKK